MIFVINVGYLIVIQTWNINLICMIHHCSDDGMHVPMVCKCAVIDFKSKSCVQWWDYKINFKAKSQFTFRKQISKLKLTLQHQIYVTSLARRLPFQSNKCFQQDQHSCLWKTLSNFWFKYQMMNTQTCSKMFKQSKSIL